MASRRSSKSNGAHAQLLKMVNDQRAKCNLSTLDAQLSQNGVSWIEAKLEHARQLYKEYSIGETSEGTMNVNILRSPAKSPTKHSPHKVQQFVRSPLKEKLKQKLPKKATSSKKPSPHKKSRIPKESTPPRKSPKKISASSRNISPCSSTSTKVALRESTSSRGTLVEKRVEKTSEAVDFETPAPKAKEVEVLEREADVIEIVAPEVSEVEAVRPEEKEVEMVASESREVEMVISGAKEDDLVAQANEADEKVVSEASEVEMATPEAKEVEMVAEEGDEIEMVAGEGEEVETVAAEEKEVIREAPEAKEHETAAPKTSMKRKSEEIELELEPEAKKRRSDALFSEGEVIPAPKPSLRERIDRFRAIFSPASSSPRPSPPKRPQLSNIAKPVSAAVIPRVSPPDSPGKKSLHLAASFIPVSPPKTLVKKMPPAVAASVAPLVSPPKALAKKSPPVVVAAAVNPRVSPPESPVKKSLPVAASLIPVSPPKNLAKKVQPPVSAASNKTATTSTTASTTRHFNNAASSVSTSHTVKTTSSTLHQLPLKVVAPVRGSSIQIAAPVPIRPSTQIKPVAAPVKVVPSQAAPVITLANPFQKAQQQQQQQVLATTSHLRTAKEAAMPIPSTAHIELEEPDSAYSDSEDEETVRKRLQHKPWETREGLAQALEEQATIDADMIFGIPHGAVPIDEILPPDNEHARAKRARPRSSSATWSRDGLKQIEIDRYNERMGIQGPGVLLPITVQDDGSGTPSRSHRLSAIAQSAVSQGQVSRKPSFSAHRGSLSPVRPGSVLSSYASTNLASSTIKYPQLVAGTPNRAKSTITNTASTQKAKVSKPAPSASVSSSKPSKPSMAAKNPFQNGSNTLQTSRIAAGPAKTTVAKK